MAKPSRLTPHDARAELRRCGAPIASDYHALRRAVVDELAQSARRYAYRQGPHANGSRARCWHAYLVRVAQRD